MFNTFSKLNFIGLKRFNLFTAIVLVVLYTIGANAGKPINNRYNCNPDKLLEQAGSFSLQVLSSDRIGLLMQKGNDAAGMSDYGYEYRLVDASGLEQRLKLWVQLCYSVYFHADGIIAGLNPSSTYKISMISRDNCGNQAESVPQEFKTPEAISEYNFPMVINKPSISYSYFLGARFNPKVAIYVDDDSGIDRLDFFIDGQSIGTKYNEKPHLFTRTQGDLYEASIPSQYVGSSHFFEVRVTDIFGNQKTESATLTPLN
jgi:hypothetical protein